MISSFPSIFSWHRAHFISIIEVPTVKKNGWFLLGNVGVMFTGKEVLTS